jgi:hypothetical protein
VFDEQVVVFFPHIGEDGRPVPSVSDLDSPGAYP